MAWIERDLEDHQDPAVNAFSNVNVKRCLFEIAHLKHLTKFRKVCHLKKYHMLLETSALHCRSGLAVLIAVERPKFDKLETQAKGYPSPPNCVYMLLL